MLERLTGPLGRMPAAVVAVLFVLGAVLADLHVLLAEWVADDREPPQWVARATLMLYYVILPLACLGYWRHRAEHLRGLGRSGAWMVATQPPIYVVVALTAVIHGAVLDRGDLPDAVMAVDSLLVAVFYLGVVVLAAAAIRAGGSDRAIGLLLLVGLVLSFVAPFLLTACFVTLAVVLLRHGLGEGEETAEAAVDAVRY